MKAPPGAKTAMQNARASLRPFKRARRRIWLFVLWPAALFLLWWAFRQAPLPALGEVLGRLGWQRLGLLLLINALVILSFSARWWVILRALGHPVHYLPLSAYRLAGFAISYFTPGPQFGGEPLLISLLRRHQGITLATALASVALDRTLELVANFSFLALGLAAALRVGLIPSGWEWPSIALALGLLSLPVGFLLAAGAGRLPLSALINRWPEGWPGAVRLAGWRHNLAQSEAIVSVFCRRRPGAVLAALLVSSLSWLMLLAEYGLAMRFFALESGWIEILAALSAARLAILLPFPGGLGVLEASQVLALQSLGYTAAEGVGMGLFIRARDLIFGVLGLALGLVLFRPAKRGDSEADVIGSP